MKVLKRSGNNLFVKGKTDLGSSSNGMQRNTWSKTKKKGQGFNKKGETRKCFHCNKPGHLKKNCYDWIRKQKSVNTESNVAYADNNVIDPEVLTVSRIDHTHDWVLDLGCYFHMSPNRDWFQDFRGGEYETVYMGNNNTCRVLRLGNITLRLDDGKLIVLSNVRYILELKRNLISLSTLDESGCSYKAERGCINVFKITILC